jgi:hypothetical protein
MPVERADWVMKQEIEVFFIFLQKNRLSRMPGTYTSVLTIAAVLALLILTRIVLKWYWKNQTLPYNKALFNKEFTLTYNDVFNDLSCVKTEWSNVQKVYEFSRMVIELKDKKSLRFKGMFTSMKFNALVSNSRSIEKMLGAEKVLIEQADARDEKTIAYYHNHKAEFERYDETFSAFLKKVTDIPKPVKIDTW